jgi:bifunctional non-homologous end joining protein LigD
LNSQFYKGEMRISLNGHKLKGKFALIKDSSKGDNSWYLIKVKDSYASTTDVTSNDKSVVSGLTIAEMTENPKAKKWQSNRANKEEVAKGSAELDQELLKQGVKSPMPPKVEPMNCTLIKEPFNDPAWTYELKLDGYRIIAIKKGPDVKLFSRSSLNYSKRYPAITEALKQLQFDAIIDGEVVVTDEKGRPDFDLLQKYREGMPIVYYCFDLLWLDGYDITGLTLMQRKALLKTAIPVNDLIKYSEDFDDGELLFEQIKIMKLEGIVAKRKDSKYQPGKRVKDWLKLPTEVKQEFVIGGWTESESGRGFRTMVFGAYENGELKFVGHSGSGFTDKAMQRIADMLLKIEIKKKPFVDEVDHSTPLHWVKPILVGNFKFSTWTAGGKIRKPAIFLGFREDKDPKDVVREVPLSAKDEEKLIKENTSEVAFPDIGKKEQATSHKIEHVDTSADSHWSEIEKQEITSAEDFEIEGNQLRLTNVEKELWQGITKAHLIQYYHAVAPYILPHLQQRPQSLLIKLFKPTAPGLYIKDMEGRQPGGQRYLAFPQT